MLYLFFMVVLSVCGYVRLIKEPFENKPSISTTLIRVISTKIFIIGLIDPFRSEILGIFSQNNEEIEIR